MNEAEGDGDSAEHYLLTANVAPYIYNKDSNGYDSNFLNEELDFVNIAVDRYRSEVMKKLISYWIQGKNDVYTDYGIYDNPLYCDGKSNKFYCIDKSVRIWIAKGLCPQKIVLGTF